MKNIAQQGLSRQQLLDGVTGALAAFGLAGCAPQGKQDATADAAEPANAAGSDANASAADDWLGSAPDFAANDIKETSRPTC